MHAALLARPQEVKMLTRRLATASACALALAVPAIAGAQPIQDAPVAYGGPASAPAHVAYGDTKYDLQNQQDQKTAKPTRVDRIASLTPQQLAAAYGSTQPPAPANTPAAKPTVVANDGSSDGWQIAAIGEAALIAAFAFGSVAVVRARRRSPHVGV
jgi:hypothetical protein